MDQQQPRNLHVFQKGDPVQQTLVAQHLQTGADEIWVAQRRTQHVQSLLVRGQLGSSAMRYTPHPDGLTPATFPKREERQRKLWQERKKARNFGSPHFSGPHPPAGPTLRALTPPWRPGQKKSNGTKHKRGKKKTTFGTNKMTNGTKKKHGDKNKNENREKTKDKRDEKKNREQNQKQFFVCSVCVFEDVFLFLVFFLSLFLVFLCLSLFFFVVLWFFFVFSSFLCVFPFLFLLPPQPENSRRAHQQGKAHGQSTWPKHHNQPTNETNQTSNQAPSTKHRPPTTTTPKKIWITLTMKIRITPNTTHRILGTQLRAFDLDGRGWQLTIRRKGVASWLWLSWGVIPAEAMTCQSTQDLIHQDIFDFDGVRYW